MVKNRLPRPEGWSPEFVLARLGEGKSVNEICADGAASLGDPVATRRLYEDIKAWKKTRPDFAEIYKEQVTDRLGTFVNRNYNPNLKFTPEVQEEFFEAMEREGGKISAALATLPEKVRVRPEAIYAKLNPMVGTFDPVFAERYHRLEAARYHHVRERAFDIAGDSTSRAAPRMIEFLLKTGMPHLHSERQLVEHQGKVEHRHLHSVDRAALSAFEEKLARLTAAPRLLEGDIQDAVYEEAS